MELVNILESCNLVNSVLFFDFSSGALAYTLPCGQIAFKSTFFDSYDGNDLRLSMYYLLTIFHELYH
jgi:hypothetical protein